MICTVTLNASIDKAYRLPSPLVDGTVMRVASCIDNAGGKGLNAARSIDTCGEEALATGFVGGNNGRHLCELLARDGIREDFVRVASETRCCINVLEPDGRSTEFLEPGREVTREEVAALHDRVEAIARRAQAVTVNGSAPKGFTPADYALLVERVRRAEATCLIDASGELLRAAATMRPDFIKPNADEISQLLGHEAAGEQELLEGALELHERGVGTVVISLGAKGALMVSPAGRFRGVAPSIEVVNPVGSGDTMVGAFAVAMARGMEATGQLRYAMSCAAANCLSASTGHFSMDQARELFGRTQVEPLS